MKKLIVLAVLLILGIGSVAYAPTTESHAQGADPIRIGSKTFAENAILAQMMIIILNENGYATTDYTYLGNTDTLRAALVNDQLDAYPEYTGTAIVNFFRAYDWVTFAPETPYDKNLSFAVVSSYDAAINDLVWLQPAPANNTFGIAVTRAFATEHNLVTMSDWASFINGGGTVYFVGSEEFMLRDDGLPSFERTYGFDLQSSQVISIIGVGPDVTEKALFDGVNGINAAMVYGTDGGLVGYDLVLLEDNLFAQPIYQPTPVFRGEVIRNNPEIVGLINPIFATLDNATLQNLNKRVEVDGELAADVARSYLQEKGFIE